MRLIRDFYKLCSGTAVKIVKRFGAENAEIALLARNGKHVGSDERAGTLALDDEWCRSRDKCPGVSGTEAPMWGQCNSFFLPQKYK